MATLPLRLAVSIRWRLVLIDLLPPVLFLLSAIIAWFTGSGTWADALFWVGALYVMVRVFQSTGNKLRSFQAYAAIAFLYCLGRAFYTLINGGLNVNEGTVSEVSVILTIMAGLAIVGVIMVEIHFRVDRIEASPNSTRTMEFPGIYCITCQANKKQYIGQTSLSIRERWNQHRQDLHIGRHHNRWLQSDWNLYRPEQFTIEVLEVVTDPVWLLDRERYWQDLDFDAARRYNPPNIAPRVAKKATVKVGRKRAKPS